MPSQHRCNTWCLHRGATAPALWLHVVPPIKQPPLPLLTPASTQHMAACGWQGRLSVAAGPFSSCCCCCALQPKDLRTLRCGNVFHGRVQAHLFSQIHLQHDTTIVTAVSNSLQAMHDACMDVGA